MVVVTEESSISKGIRRLVGLTGAEALDVQRASDDLQHRISELAKNSSNPDVVNSNHVDELLSNVTAFR